MIVFHFSSALLPEKSLVFSLKNANPNMPDNNSRLTFELAYEHHKHLKMLLEKQRILSQMNLKKSST